MPAGDWIRGRRTQVSTLDFKNEQAMKGKTETKATTSRAGSSLSKRFFPAKLMQKELVFYRGICVEPDRKTKARDHIVRHGLQEKGPHSGFAQIIDKRARFEEFLKKPDLTIMDVEPYKYVEDKKGWQTRINLGGTPAICACGEEGGATYYALKRNKNLREGQTEPLIIKFRAKVEDVSVDGCDFMIPCIQSGDEVRRSALEGYFGKRALFYFDHAKKSTDTEFRIAVSYLALQDPKIVLDHYANQTFLGGRYGTVFCNQFRVKLPIPAEFILSVEEPCMEIPVPMVNIYRLRESRRATN